MVETRDPLGNRVAVKANDYRVMQPRLVSDPNSNETEISFDTLGLVVGTAVMGKPLPALVEGGHELATRQSTAQPPLPGLDPMPLSQS